MSTATGRRPRGGMVLAPPTSSPTTGNITRISKRSLLPHVKSRKTPPSKLDRKRNLPIMYHEDGIKNVVTIYNGKTVKSCAIEQFQKGKNSKSSFISVEKNHKMGIYETLKETYQRIHEERDVFLQTIKKFGLGIDLSYHNWSYKRTALWLFERLSIGVPANDPLDPI
ncbi:hypothetical protein RhiirA5_387565 [Rhizophagus irregularis]|uniref:Uncharacterized protein n=1 Tax=Rhizophagus irregularis TaxID=588596 RepID=A0A2N0NE02_9GLOM|nr:hypothetical protein RhiirA5_387565 [Rhizophagus irregularis]